MAPPLEGMRVLTISQFGAGPYATMSLAELGAEIIKIEDPQSGDVSRTVPPFTADHDSLYFQAFNRNKKSITLNLKLPEGQRLFRALVSISDAVFNNLRGDQGTELGLHYEDLRDWNAKIVCCSLVGFAARGPRASEPGYDYLMQACTGYMSMTGDPSTPPSACGVSVIDHAAGLAAAYGVVAGLYAARESGRGRDIEVSLFDVALSMLSYLAVWNLNRDYVPVRRPGSAHQSLVPVQTFRTADGHILIFCAKEKFWTNLCIALDVPEMASEVAFKTFVERMKNRDNLVDRLGRIFVTRTTLEWLEKLRGSVPCAPVNDLHTALHDPFLVQRRMIVETEHPIFGTIKQIGGPIKVSDSEILQRRAPRFGEHTQEVLQGLLKISDAEIEQLRAKHVI